MPDSSRWSLAPIARAALFVLASFAPLAPALAQSSTASPAAGTRLPSVVVTGNPLGSSELATPATVLTGEALVLRRGSSLGETLSGLPGVSATYFGPNASRPIIRGLDGDRVRLLNNAGASFDASSLSYDHAVPIDPLIVQRLEVLRGPAALLYGGSAIGGAVNAIDNRLPRERVNGVGGAAEARVGGADSERGGAALVDAGNGAFALHADVFGRRTDDLRVPRYTPIEDGTPLDPTRRVRNSASRTQGGAIGGSAFFDRGFAGLSADDYDSRYGMVAEPDVTIRMKRRHIGLAGELRFDAGPLRKVEAQFNDTRYRHQEIEGSGEVGTTFRNDGRELRVEAQHAPLGPLRGAIGVQLEHNDFSALGEEAFVPRTTTKRQGLFALEELSWAGGTLTGGFRFERSRVGSDGDAGADLDEPRFGPAAERRFSLRSASLANVWKLTPQWSLSGTASVTERAPTSFELFANGVHAATAAYERGDPNLRAERGRNLDLALAWKQGDSSLRIGVFASRFSRFISLDATGERFEDGDESLPVYAFRSVRAKLHGLEIEGSHRAHLGTWTLDGSARLDATRATNADTGEPLPRVAPLRASIALGLKQGAWGVGIDLEGVARQKRVPALDAPTAGYGLVNASLTRRFTLGPSDGVWFVKLGNLTDKLAYSATTIATVRDLAPLPGRSLKTGVRLSF